MSRSHNHEQRQQDVPAVDGKSLTPLDVAVQIRARLIDTCWRPDKDAKQIIIQAAELETYILNGQP